MNIFLSWLRPFQSLYQTTPFIRVFKRGDSPSLLNPSPSPSKERGIKGVRMT